MKVYGEIQVPTLRDPPFNPLPAPRLRYAGNLFRAIAERDVLLHHPYESFRHVIDFIEQAADDPDVVAIKQTLYRTSGDSPIVRALTRAAERGKDVTALVELKARFDEANNIAWARRLEESGVHVVYGLIGLKTHSKMLLVTRREGERLRRYLHLGTGNYHPSTARLYTDLGLFTAREDITHDAMLLFNVLTGYAELPDLKQLVVAPFTLRQHVLERIQAEIEHARAGRPAGLVAKMNSLVDGEVIEALYRASQAGVKIDLVIRGICCLRPGVPGISENIRVRSILDRFLEHSRIFWWKNGGEDLLYLSSADWMPRNLNRRIECCFPVLDAALARRVTEEMLPVELADNTFAWELGPDGAYVPLAPAEGERPRRAQQEFIEAALERSKNRRPGVRSELPVTGSLSPVMRLVEAQRRRRADG
jgi:polyphosphate kinase